MEEELLNIRLDYIKSITESLSEEDKQEVRDIYIEELDLITHPRVNKETNIG